jgi:hypothetical protein
MNRPSQPESEIRDALDREVRRVFDPTRLAATLEQRRPHEPPPRQAGPLSRVPPVVQWVGVVAAVIAAITGLRSLVLDLTAPGPVPAIAERAVPEPVARIEPQIVRDAAGPRPLPPVGPSVPSPAQAPPEPAPAQAERAVQPETRRTTKEPAGAAAPRVPPGRAPNEAPTQTQPFAAAPPVARPEEQGMIVQVTFPRLADQALPGVRVTSLRLGEREVTGEIMDLPEIDATLIAIRGRGEPRVPSRGRRSFTPPIEALEDQLQEGPLYVRVLLGLAEGSLSSTPHVVLDKDLELVPLEELERVATSWLDEERVLERRFKLSSIVALDAFRIGAREESRRFVARIGDRRYEMRVTRDRPGNGIGLVIAPHEGDESIRATVSIANDRLAILAIPESMLPGGDARHGGDTLFVTLSALSVETFERVTASGPSPIVDDPEQAPILLSETGPGFEIASPGHGDVRLLALVGKNGTVSAIKILEHPPGSGEQLALEAAGTVRGWRYLPARHRGLEVATWVEIALSPR